MTDFKLGVVGGMGPFATVEFCRKVLELTPVTHESEHINMIVDINPRIPSRSNHFFDGSESFVPEIVKSIKALSAFSPNMIVMPCNNASYRIDQIREESNTNMVDIIEVTANAVKIQYPMASRVVVLGTKITYFNKTYCNYLNRLGLDYIHVTIDEYERIELIIDSVRNNNMTKKTTNELNSYLFYLYEKYNPDIFVFGCTELGCIKGAKSRVPCLDSIAELAKFVVQAYLSHLNEFK